MSYDLSLPGQLTLALLPDILLLVGATVMMLVAAWKPESAALHNFAELDGGTRFADVRLAWNEFGLGVQVTVTGKSDDAQGDADKPRSSDGVSLWIDTRDARTSHRASRYCHQFHLLPTGGGADKDEPAFAQTKINRALQDAPLCSPADVPFRCHRVKGGYRVEAFLGGNVLTGFDPERAPWDNAFDFSTSLDAYVNPANPLDGFRRFPLPDRSGYPAWLAVDAQGGIWFTEMLGNRVGRLDPDTGMFVQVPLPHRRSDALAAAIFDTGGPGQIAIAPDGAVLIVESFDFTVDRVDADYLIATSLISNTTATFGGKPVRGSAP